MRKIGGVGGVLYIMGCKKGWDGELLTGGMGGEECFVSLYFSWGVLGGMHHTQQLKQEPGK